MSVDAWYKQNNKGDGSIFTPNMSLSVKEEQQGGDEPLTEILKWLITLWQECCSISKEYFPNKIAGLSVIDHYNDDTESYFCDLYNKLQVLLM